MIILLWLSKFTGFLLRFFKLGGGTSLPGLLIERYSPSYIAKLAKGYKKIILITGTNGKTTTQKLIYHLLQSGGFSVCSNKSGANLIRGIAAAIISDCTFSGEVKSDIGVFEVEEATMPILTQYISPDYIVVTNLFRDQLDAYGEVLKTRDYILSAIETCKKAKVILNGDDENVSSIANGIGNKVMLFLVEDKRVHDIFYERKYFSFKRRSRVKKFYAKSARVASDLSTTFSVYGFKEVLRGLKFTSPGVHYIYNALAALAVVMDVAEISFRDLKSYFSSFTPAFGRGEIIKINGKQLRIILIKNPASFTANLDLIKNLSNLKLLIIINDKIADGTDISWLWDARLEVLQKSDITWITVSGTRALDMALRLKYAEIESRKIEVEENISKALDIALSKLGEGEILIILPTYTAMLEVRKTIGGIVKVKEFWR